MVTQASKSRSAVNENMENPMVRDENINHLPYVVQDTSYHELYTADPDNQQHDADVVHRLTLPLFIEIVGALHTLRTLDIAALEDNQLHTLRSGRSLDPRGGDP
jgi:hypothetical protein